MTDNVRIPRNACFEQKKVERLMRSILRGPLPDFQSLRVSIGVELTSSSCTILFAGPSVTKSVALGCPFLGLIYNTNAHLL
jgi:hypothetical protein